MSLQHAYQELVDNSGTQYDPGVIIAFQKVWAEGKLTINSPM
jgi:hypothetical protein